MKMTGSILLLFVVVLGLSLSSSKAYKLCYNCVGVASAADCGSITRCGDQQECFEEKVINSLNTHYNSGCRSKTSCQAGQIRQNGTAGELIVCSKCCDTDFCNVGLCGGGISRSLRCSRCYGPTMQISDCHRIEQCSEDEMCYAHRVLEFSSLEARYEAGCRSKLQCQGLANAPIINQCFECCDTPMCNLYKCGNNWTAVYHTSSQPSITEATAIPTRAVHHYNVVINGPASVAYHGNGSLKCTSNVQAGHYTWKFNEHTFPSEHDNILYIHNMTEANVGTYKCIVSKDGASAEAKTNVTITEAAAAVISVSSLPWPAQIGKELNIYCKVTGYPVPVVHWIFTNSQGKTFVPEEVHFPSNGIIRVQSFQPASHSGNWTCVAMNSLGTGISDIIITVYHTSSQPSITEATAIPTRAVHHYNVVINGPASVAYHGNGSLKCTSNVQAGHYTWKFNEHTFPSEHDNILYIHNMTEANVGTYKCIVSKDGASAEAKTNVTITEAAAVVISVSSLPRPAQIGKELNIYCKATGYPVPVVRWIFTNLQGKSFIPGEVHLPSNGIIHFQSFQPASYSGNWTCVAMNSLGTGVSDIFIN